MNTLMVDKVKSNCSFLLKLNENDNINRVLIQHTHGSPCYESACHL